MSFSVGILKDELSGGVCDDGVDVVLVFVVVDDGAGGDCDEVVLVDVNEVDEGGVNVWDDNISVEGV